MKRFLLAATATVGTMLASAPAQALTFDFSFTEAGCSYSSCTVSGEIDGLADNTSNEAASDVILEGYPSGASGIFTNGPPVDVFTIAGVSISPNSFSVFGGEITAASLTASAISFLFILSSPTGENLLENTFTDAEIQYESITFTPVGAATPIPAAAPLFATGLGAMGLLGWRRKRKAADVAT